MELKYIVMTIIKIIISVPTILVVYESKVYGAALMGGYLNNSINSTNPTNYTDNILKTNISTHGATKNDPENEEIPDPSALVLPGYNLPENIFNKGKPFYLEKDPLTGQIDFGSRSTLSNLDDEEEFYYSDEESTSNIYEKSSIDRKDGSLASHKPSDVNQLTPNFHDFLNLPVKYNPDKYVYPLISNSYANTKVQGNINKYYNHKNYAATTYKPIINYDYRTLKTPYFNHNDNKVTLRITTTKRTTRPTTTSVETTTTTTSTTPKPIILTTKLPNILNNAMSFPKFFTTTTEKIKKKEIPTSTTVLRNSYLTTKRFSIPTTTRRTLSLLEQLFGEYDEIPTTENIAKAPPPFENMSSNNKTSVTEKYETTEIPNVKEIHNVLTGTEMDYEGAYIYDDDYETLPSEYQNNTIANTKPFKFEVKPTVPISLATVIPKITSTVVTTTKSPSTIITTTTHSPTKYDSQLVEDSDYEFETEETETPKSHSNLTTVKVTSLPLGENHFGNHNLRSSIISVTPNIKEQLNNEKVILRPFHFHRVASSSNIHIPPNQNTVSFVVGNHQNVEGSFIDTFKEETYDGNKFRPLITQANNDKDTVSYSVQGKPAFNQNFAESLHKITKVGGSSMNIQPIKTSEASLSIGVPINNVKKIPGQVVDENLDNEKIEFPKKGTGAKIVFPDDAEERPSSYAPDLIPPPKQPFFTTQEILQLNSKPMYHQLPSDLTPPNEQNVPLKHIERPRPPWDPRPGHFYNGRPEYSRPPRPQLKPAPSEIYKRIDNLPNILPQFRPNAKLSNPPHYFEHGNLMKHNYMRQPLLDRPSNKPIGFFEKLVPPPPPKSIHNLRKVPHLEQGLKSKNSIDEFYQYSTPPVVLSNRRHDEEPEVETLQMIQAKQIEKKEILKNAPTSTFRTNLKGKEPTEKPIYVVYPVNSAPIKLDALASNKKETVVIGTRAELPLPPSKINKDFLYESPQDRNDSPILKPHPKPLLFPIKSDFPYPLERPEISPLTATMTGNKLDSVEDKFVSNTQWSTFPDVESQVVTGSKINYKNPNQISVTLKTYTDKPIAVAYTPTEPYKKLENTEKYSMPNYASPVISEIRPGLLEKGNSEITVSAVMHTHPQINIFNNSNKYLVNHKSDNENLPANFEFQAPFQASVNVDGISHGWSVIRKTDKSKIDRSDQDVETTTLAVASTSNFDIEKFKPQLFGGFKPIYGVVMGDELKSTSREER